MGSSTVAAPTPVKEKFMPSSAAARAPIVVPSPSQRIWTVPRIASVSSVLAVPLLVAALRPSPAFVLTAVVLEVVFTVLCAKICLMD
jgi:hypothetical protein